MPIEKLIRHRLPVAKTRVAETREMLDFLTDKLLENVAGFLADRGSKALVEVQEVVYSLRAHFGAPEVDKLAIDTFLEQGSFTRGVVQIMED